MRADILNNTDNQDELNLNREFLVCRECQDYDECSESGRMSALPKVNPINSLVLEYLNAKEMGFAELPRDGGIKRQDPMFWHLYKFANKVMSDIKKILIEIEKEKASKKLK